METGFQSPDWEDRAVHKGSEDDQGGGGKSVHTCAHTHQVRVDCMYVAGRGGGGFLGLPSRKGLQGL